MKKRIPLYLRVREILNIYDPVHLYEMTEQEDEYTYEAKLIARRLRRTNYDQMTDMVHKVFVKAFFEDFAGPRDNYKQVASALYHLA